MTTPTLDPTSNSILTLLTTFAKNETLVFNYTGTNSNMAVGNFNLPNDKNIIISFYNAYVPGNINLSVTTYDPTITPTDPSNQNAVLKSIDDTTSEMIEIVYAISSLSTPYMGIIHPITTTFDARLQATTSSTGGVSITGTDTTLSPLMTPDGFGLVIVISKNSPLININLSRSNYLQTLCQKNCGSILSASSANSMSIYSPLFLICNGVWLFVFIIVLLVCSLSTGDRKILHR